MTDDIRRYTTDSAPGEQAFESTANEATTFFEEAFADAGNWYGSRASGILRTCVRVTLEYDGDSLTEENGTDGTQNR